MKSKVIIVGNLGNCKLAFEKIDLDFVDSLIFVTNSEDMSNDWFEDKTSILIDKVKVLEYDLIFIASQMVYEFIGLQEHLINLGVVARKFGIILILIILT